MKKHYIKYGIRIVFLLIIVITTLFIYRKCTSRKDNDFPIIEDSPVRIEKIKNIAQLASISYKDEVVVDSVEFYESASDLISGNLSKLIDVDNFKHGIKGSSAKRRLTIIVKGEAWIGFDFVKKPLKISENDSLISIELAHAKILQIISSEELVRVFQENGDWSDKEMQLLKQKGRRKIMRDVKKLNLIEEAEKNLEKLIVKLIPSNKKIEFSYL